MPTKKSGIRPQLSRSSRSARAVSVRVANRSNRLTWKKVRIVAPGIRSSNARMSLGAALSHLGSILGEGVRPGPGLFGVVPQAEVVGFGVETDAPRTSGLRDAHQQPGVRLDGLPLGVVEPVEAGRRRAPDQHEVVREPREAEITQDPLILGELGRIERLRHKRVVPAAQPEDQPIERPFLHRRKLLAHLERRRHIPAVLDELLLRRRAIGCDWRHGNRQSRPEDQGPHPPSPCSDSSRPGLTVRSGQCATGRRELAGLEVHAPTLIGPFEPSTRMPRHFLHIRISPSCSAIPERSPATVQ